MDKGDIVRNNQGFFLVAVNQSICQRDFRDALVKGFIKGGGNVIYPVKIGAYDGFIMVDASDIADKCSQACFSILIDGGIFRKVASQLSRSIKGEFNSEADVKEGIYSFVFRVDYYQAECGQTFRSPEEMSELPENEDVARVVNLKITIP